MSFSGVIFRNKVTPRKSAGRRRQATGGNMRLTCPNCGAQYEVPDEVIPETGRDVQCSNCGDTWFQHHPDHKPVDDQEQAADAQADWDSPEDETELDFAPEEDEAEDTANVSDDTGTEDEPQGDTWPEDTSDDFEEAARDDAGDADQDAPEVAEPDEDAASADEDDGDLEDEGDPDDQAQAEDPPRRGLDPAIANLLREEATREEEARAAESGGEGLETQPDLGLDERSESADERSEQAKSRMARLRGLPEDGAMDEPDDDPDPSLISRRNLLPDIDEINSSLDSETTRAEDGEAAVGDAAAAVRKGGFNRGFMRGVLLVLVLVLLYLLAPVISENVPALANAMEGYVNLVNSGRVWLNDMIGGMLAGE